MNCKIGCLRGAEIIHITLYGVIKIPEITQMASTMVDIASRHKILRVLIDSRDATMDMSLPEISACPEIFIGLKFDMASKVAIFTTKKSREYHFFEITALDKGLNFRIFTNIEKASKWLVEK